MKVSLAPVKERYEFKYLVPVHCVEAISDFVSLYCTLDHYSELASGNNYFYQVNSLYFDTPNFEFLQHSLWGKTERFNMRVRAYGASPYKQYFLEIKQRTGSPDILKKYRARLDAQHWPHILTDPAFRTADTETASQRANLHLFMRQALSYAIEPKILTRYQRRAFASTIDEYARITLDTNLKSQLTSDYDLHNNQAMLNYDHQMLFAEAGNINSDVILELKCNVGTIPGWMIDLIKRFELKQLSFSKFGNSTRLAHAEHNHQFQTLDRLYTAYCK